MKRVANLLTVVILFFSLTRCNFRDNTCVIEGDLCLDSTYLDSLRQVKCDSLLILLNENKASYFKDIVETPKGIEESILLLNEKLNDTIKEWIRCTKEGNFVNISHFGLGMYIRNKWGLWASSDLAKEFQENGIFHPDDMSTIILYCTEQYVKKGTYNLDEELRHFSARAKEQEDYETNQRNEYQRFCATVDSFNKVIYYEKNLRKIQGLVLSGRSNDFYILRKNKDTVEHSFTRHMNSVSLKRYQEIVKEKNFYNTVFYGGVSDIGKIDLWTLKQERFIMRKDEIFYELYTDSFVKIFSKEMIKNPDFNISIAAERDCQYSNSFLKFQWLHRGRNYYYFIIEGDCGSSKIRKGFYLDENLKLVFNKSIHFELNNSKVIYQKNSYDD